ncbi:hypothetical protein [Pyxidicoccus trucidator]|uniref:hypothetical protein n=1 Tax=Pyxidicoccus trucidator TaxID=2709662 RepID=UPI0013DA7136|nr:hypothetical protein [Pyxidicoccus trucidator]
MTTWSPHAFARGLAALRAFAESEPDIATRARADFPESWGADDVPWMGSNLMAWLLHGHEDAEGRTAADRRLLKEGPHLPRAERALMAALAASWCSVFEVEEVHFGTGLRLRDLLLDEVLEVRERSLTLQVVHGDVMVAWAMPAGGHLELVGGPVLVPPPLSEHFVSDARQELAGQLPAGDVDGRHRQVRRLAPFLFRRAMELFTAEPPLPELIDSELIDSLVAAPQRRVFQDAAERPPRRPAGKDEALEPGSAYVFKLGPIDTHLDRRAALYVAATSDGAVLPPVLGRRDAEGLEALARGLEGRKRYCEGRLARAGAAFGYASRRMPSALAKLRAVLAVHLYWGPDAPSDLAPERMDALLSGFADLIREAPWELWTNEEVFTVHLEGAVQGTREVSVMGGGGSEFGFALFDRSGSVERMAMSGPPREGLDVLIPDSLGVTLEDEPSWAVKAVQQAFGLPFVPEVMRIQRNTPRLANVEELLEAAAVARALALASAQPEEREVEVVLLVGDVQVRARLEIPLPLFSGEYVGKALPAKSSGWRPTHSKRPLRKVPTRKVSETLLEFAKPLLEDVESLVDPQDELFLILALAMSAWNAVVQDTWEPEKGWVERARATLRRMPKDDREQMTRDFELLVERKRRDFADDPRLFDALDIVVHRKGDLGVQLMGIVTPGAWEDFLGV